MDRKIKLDGWERFRQNLALPPEPRVLVVGLERTGLSLCRFLADLPVSVTVTDQRGEADLIEQLDRLPQPDFRLELGGHDPDTFVNSDCIFVSPGVPLTQKCLVAARSQQVPIVNDIELSFHVCGGTIIGITGSNGKTTVTDLVGRITGQASLDFAVAGNIGRPVLDVLSQSQHYPIHLVLEISSFQLEAVRFFKPDIGILTNLVPDHLDRYETVSDYFDAKMRLFENQSHEQWAVLNFDDPEVCRRSAQVQSRIFWFSRHRAVEQGVWVDGDGLIRARFLGEEQTLFSMKEVRLSGQHNRENVLAAVAAGLLAGIPLPSIEDNVLAYQGLPHRYEKVADFNGRDFINDSKATNVGAVLAALSGQTRAVHLIAGGRNKGDDFSPLLAKIGPPVTTLYLIGEAADYLTELFRNRCPVFRCGSLEQAVHKAYEHSHPGEIILLSPGCASFDMFRNYEDRGDTFREIVFALMRKEKHAPGTTIR